MMPLERFRHWRSADDHLEWIRQHLSEKDFFWTVGSLSDKVFQ